MGGPVTRLQPMSRETILVTGAYGAIGSFLIRELVQRDVPVVGLDLAADPATPFPELGDVPIVRGDTRDTALIGPCVCLINTDKVEVPVQDRNAHQRIFEKGLQEF